MPELRHDPEGNRDERPVDWTTAHLYIHLSRIVADQAKRIDDHTLAVERSARASVESAEKALQAAFTASEKAVAKQEAANEKRFDDSQAANEKRFDDLTETLTDRFASVNEFRGTLSDQATKFISRTEVEARLTSLAEKIGDTATHVERIESTGMGLKQGWGLLVGGIGLLMLLYSAFNRPAPVPSQAAPVYVAQPPSGSQSRP